MNAAENKETSREPTQAEPGYWGKVDILLKPIGGLATAAVVAYIGYLGSDILQDRQQTNARVQLYAQIMSSREQAETGLRREMFNSIIQTFLHAQTGQAALPRERVLEQRLLALQLLTYNFHDALDLGPLFKYLEREIIEIHGSGSDEGQATLARLKRTARDVVAKQIAVLESDGETKSENFELRDSERGMPRINEVLQTSKIEIDKRGVWGFGADREGGRGVDASRFTELRAKNFRVEMIDWDVDTEEVQVRLMVRHPETSRLEIDEVFWVGSFDFPLIDNTRLSGGGRCAVVLEKISIYDPPETLEEDEKLYGEVKLNLVYFPGSRASLKSRPYYDEVIRQTIGR